jgi:DNA-binding NtrC family response regulator
MELLNNYSWPGNVRELEHAIERVLVITDATEIDVEHLPFVIANAETPSPASEATLQLTPSVPRAIEIGERLEFDASGRLDLPKLTDDIERRAIEEALRRCDGVMTEAAKALNITRRMLRYKMDKLGVPPPRSAAREPDDAELPVSSEPTPGP